MQVLIAEDDIHMQNMLLLMVQSFGHEVFTADNGREAWELYQTHQFPMIISDWLMPELSGVELCKRIRISQKLNYTYIILVSSMSGRKNYLEGMDAGADDFVGKPVDKDELHARIRVGERIISLQIQLEEMSQTDGLTNLANRRRFDEALNEEWRRAKRTGIPVSLIMIDIDHFKKYNDNYGHLEGDYCLKQVSTVLAHTGNRPGDLVARFGGEEFVVLLSGASLEPAKRMAENLRAAVSNLKLRHEYSENADHITISLGLASIVPAFDQNNPHVLISLADTALYQAKKSGRNRVVVFKE
ncbi:MAG: diguanylate cyclase [Bacteroidetes bacterium]|nr:diguanylate cyclase [Bacteroidota bacterium]